MAAAVSGRPNPRPAKDAERLTALPELSQHVSDAMDAAWKLAGAELPLTVGHLVAGATFDRMQLHRGLA